MLKRLFQNVTLSMLLATTAFAEITTDLTPTESLSEIAETAQNDVAAGDPRNAGFEMYVQMDLTEGRSRMTVIKKNGDQIEEKSYLISPQRSAKSDGLEEDKENHSLYCGFPTLGRLIPVTVDYMQTSHAHGSAEFNYAIQLDHARHSYVYQSNLSNYAPSSIGIPRAYAKTLFDDIEKNTVRQDGVVLRSSVLFDVIDNTPGIQEKRLNCIKRCIEEAARRKMPCTTAKMSDLVKPVTPLSTKEFRDTDPRLLRTPARLTPFI